MNSRSRYGVQLLCAAIAICVVALPVSAQESPARLASADVGYVLSVSGVGGFHVEQAYKPGSTPSLSQLLANGDFLADGAYTYEIRVVPALDNDSRAVLRLARETGDLSEVERLQSEGIIPEYALASSGGFTIAQGQMVSGDVKEVSVASGDGVSAENIDLHIMDQVILDDLIVDGSICAGFDCVNGESFGFDTIRLKENNLRIKFQDTSTSASFPTNDWQITANDSANGGLNKFSIDDIDGGRTPFTIEAGAPSHSLYVDDGGRLGLGTSTPVVDAHIKTGNTPTLRLEQDGSSGFTAQTWDVAGNETNFFIRDATNGSTLPFRIRPGAPSSAIDVAASGNVGIGTSSPDRDLDIESSDDDGATLRLTNTGSIPSYWDVHASGANGNFYISDDGGTFSRVPLKIGTSADNNLLRIGIPSSSTVQVNGTLSVIGSVEVDGSVVHADYVFDPSYDLISVEDHAEMMWSNKHLPSLPAAPEGGTGTVDLISHQMGILTELETAHIYVEQLHKTVKEQQTAIAELQARLAALESAKNIE